MSDTPRFQAGDNCYDTSYQASQAHLAAQTPYGTIHDFGEGSGPGVAIVSPVRAHDEYAPGEEWHERGSLEYQITGVRAEQLFTASLSVPYYPQACVLDGVRDAHIADMSAMWMAFFVVGIVIVCLKGVQRLFDSAPHNE